MKKLVAETLYEYTASQDGEAVNEILGLSRKEKYAKLNKDDEKAVRDFAADFVSATVSTDSEVARKKLKALPLNSKIEDVKSFLEKASTDDFSGRVALVYDKLTYKPKSELKLQSATAPVVKSHGGLGTA